MDEMILEARSLSKSFFGNAVLDDVSLDLRAGEVHTVLGENGAGKSTLVKIIAGIYKKDSGQILIDGQSAEIDTPLAARYYGIAMIFQELNLLPNLRVFENIYLGRERKKAGLLEDRVIIQQSSQLLKDLHINVDCNELVENLKISDRQMVEIAKALSLDARIIIMDEPTSSLSEKEIETFFSIVKRLKREQKVSFIFISHRLKEVAEISDRITILRDGKKISTLDLHEEPYNEANIVRMMVGRDFSSFFARKGMQEESAVKQTEPILEVKNLGLGSSFSDVSFSVYPGEVLGIAGLVGSGRTEVLNAIMGIEPQDTGTVYFEGRELSIRNPKAALSLGIGFVPEDRRELGLIVELSVKQNATLSMLKRLVKGVLINKRKEEAIAEDSVRNLDIKTSGIEQLAKYLSGGNQQKVVIAKSLNTQPKIMLLDEPTRGIDVNAKHEIYTIIRRMVDNGMAVVMVSSELPEIFGEADRIIVMHEGKITGRFKNTSDKIHDHVMQSLLGVAEYDNE